MQQTKINRLKEILTEEGRSGKWLSKQLGKDPATVSKWCSNRTQPSLEVIDRMATLLGVDRKDFINSSSKHI